MRWPTIVGAVIAGVLSVGLSAPLVPIAHAESGCTWERATLRNDRGKLMPVKICRDTQGVAHRISADAFMGNPEGGALAALLGFTAAQCRSDYDLLSGSLSYDCQSASREFVTTLSGAPGTHTLYGYQLGHAPVAVFDSGSAK